MPLVAKLSREERLRLLHLAMAALRDVSDAERYAILPVARDEFGSDEDPRGDGAEEWARSP